MSKGYICDICQKFIDNPFKVRMKEFSMKIDWAHDCSVPIKIRKRVHMCGDCYTKFTNCIKHKSLKDKADEMAERAMPKVETVNYEYNWKDDEEELDRQIAMYEEREISALKEENEIPGGGSSLRFTNKLDGSCVGCPGCFNTNEDCQLCLSIHTQGLSCDEEPVCNGCKKDCPKKGENDGCEKRGEDEC